MLTIGGLREFFGIHAKQNVQGVIVYCETVSERLKYSTEYIFEHVLNIPVTLTSNREHFLQSKLPRINYSQKPIDHTFFIAAEGLLSEKGNNRKAPDPFFRSENIYFFRSREKDSYHFDIFSAVFYFISRYEEWGQFTPDRHKRFEAAESILYKNSFHLKPVVEIWISEFKKDLLGFFPGFSIPERHFRVISTIDVDNLFAYRSKGIVRTVGASIKDLLKLDLRNLNKRLAVVTGRRADPFDIYTHISDFCFDQQIPLIYFFLFKTGNRFDRTVDPRSGAFEDVFQRIKKSYALIGLHPSYRSAFDEDLLDEEKQHLSKRSKVPVQLSRQHYLRFDIRTTPRLLLRSGIRMDFTMGFASRPGFRAGTSVPFYYYDFSAEQRTDLLMVPFCAMDGAYLVYARHDPEQIFESLATLAAEIKKVNGLFVTCFHERTFSDHLYKGMGTLYKKLHLHIKQL